MTCRMNELSKVAPRRIHERDALTARTGKRSGPSVKAPIPAFPRLVGGRWAERLPCSPCLRGELLRSAPQGRINR